MQPSKTLLFLFALITITGIAPQAYGRFYMASQGRFTSRDPLGYIDGANLYEYARSNPLSVVDPQGTLVISPTPGVLNPTGYCAQQLIGTCADDPYVQSALAYMQASCAGSSMCQTWDIECGDVPDGIAVTCCLTCTITIEEGSSCGVLAHELIHAGDLCRNGRCYDNGTGCGNFGEPDLPFEMLSCGQWMCSEIRGIHAQCCAQSQGGGGDYQTCFDDLLNYYQTTGPCSELPQSAWDRLLRCCQPDSCDPDAPIGPLDPYCDPPPAPDVVPNQKVY